jgi:NTP pyrophosphatase (non-canonical NTP hydrolase)
VIDLQEIAENLRDALEANRAPNSSAIAKGDILDLQAICVAEEAGELLGAYRRWAGKARRKGTLDDVRQEIADLLICTSVFAVRLGIDIDAAIEGKLEIIYSRGWVDE